MKWTLLELIRMRGKLSLYIGAWLLSAGTVVHIHPSFGQEMESSAEQEAMPLEEGKEYEDFFGPIDADEIRRTSAEVFQSPEFRHLPKLDLGKSDGKNDFQEERSGARKAAPASRRSGGSTFGPLAKWLGAFFQGLQGVLIALLVVAGVCACLVGSFFLFRAWRRLARREDLTDSAGDEQDVEIFHALGETPPDQWLQSAREAADRGDFDAAISFLLLGAMGHVERAGLIRPRRGLTYSDYLRAVPRESPWRRVLQQLVRNYAPIGFGRRRGSRPLFEGLVAPYEAALRDVSVFEGATRETAAFSGGAQFP